MLAGAGSLSGWMGDAKGTEPDVNALARFFGALFFLMATQDVAVDGWALTMLSPERVAWAGAINSVGQTLGYFISCVPRPRPRLRRAKLSLLARVRRACACVERARARVRAPVRPSVRPSASG
jgi:hypothetical protein